VTVTVETLKELRHKTGISLAACKDALSEANGDLANAVKILRERGLKQITSGTQTTEGLIGSYVHHNKQVAVLVEIGTQTDFAARRPEVQEFAKNVAMHVASANPKWVGADDVPAEVLVDEKALIRKRYGRAPEHVFENKILPGALNSFFAEVCLLEQPYVKDPKKSLKDLLGELVSKLDEAVQIKRFVRYQIGD